MKITIGFVFAALAFGTFGAACAVPAEADTTAASQQVEAGKQLPTCRDDDKGFRPVSPVSIHKINYFALNNWPNNDNAQVKLQFSVKYKFLNKDASFQGRPLDLYLAYTQKSLWNVGQTSMPFEESNYNPEAFFDYAINLEQGLFALRDIILAPYEHESNGLAGPDSRSWNRQYAAVRLGFLPMENQGEAKSTHKDHVEVNLKVWHASGYSDQDAYLRSLGSNETFLDYEGYGEINLVFRDVLVSGEWGNRLDVTSRIGGKQNCEIQYQQKLPRLNFSPFVQYWYGYNETLLRFDRFGRRTFLGISFSY